MKWGKVITTIYGHIGVLIRHWSGLKSRATICWEPRACFLKEVEGSILVPSATLPSRASEHLLFIIQYLSSGGAHPNTWSRLWSFGFKHVAPLFLQQSMQRSKSSFLHRQQSKRDECEFLKRWMWRTYGGIDSQAPSRSGRSKRL